MQNIHSRLNPFHKPIIFIAILGLVECGDLISKDVATASEESQVWRLGRRGSEARSFSVLRLYDSKDALKMVAKFDLEADVEGAVDMMDREE